jgi:hypothetical protein
MFELYLTGVFPDLLYRNAGGKYTQQKFVAGGDRLYGGRFNFP